jgi:hypothetical protein
MPVYPGALTSPSRSRLRSERYRLLTTLTYEGEDSPLLYCAGKVLSPALQCVDASHT